METSSHGVEQGCVINPLGGKITLPKIQNLTGSIQRLLLDRSAFNRTESYHWPNLEVTRMDLDIHEGRPTQVEGLIQG